MCYLRYESGPLGVPGIPQGGDRWALAFMLFYNIYIYRYIYVMPISYNINGYIYLKIFESFLYAIFPEYLRK